MSFFICGFTTNLQDNKNIYKRALKNAKLTFEREADSDLTHQNKFIKIS